jgi:UPF0176 protein
MFTNIAAYKFAALESLKERRAAVLALCRELELKGTILLSTEGINLFVAGSPPAVDRLLAELRSVPGLEDLTPKFSESAHQPFNRMLVRIKKEIIAFGVEGIDPARRPSPKLAPHTLKQWLDEGRPVTLLDTRNDYEVKLGTFKQAVPAGIDHFREFPDAVRRLPEKLKDQPIVMFCTGGIRCEKAGPFMEREGFRQIYQLDGGILKYFEDCGSAHYEGECFVFDRRVGVDPALRETESALCFRCQAPLTVEEQADPRYQPPHSCPHCFKAPGEQRAEILHQRHEAIRRAANPLPGLQPHENRRPLIIPPDYAGATLLDFLCGIFPEVSRDEWLLRCHSGYLLNTEGQPLSADARVQAGQRCVHVQPALIEPPVNADIRILHEDEAIVVLHKPAPLPMHPGGRFRLNTLQYFLDAAWPSHRPQPAHRLDANTTGVVLCARTRHLAGRLQPQFARGEVEKTYLVRVQGCPEQESFACDAPISAGPGTLGAREVDADNGLSARTEFRVMARHADNTTLLEARPLTGRTNQIRIHLWHLGMPVCGDPVYLANHQWGSTQTLPLEAPPLCLHAWKLSFVHPLSGERVAFEAKPPAWTKGFL